MKITVIGTGYVGLVSGAVFADWGHDVVCLDIDEEKVNKINKGIMPIYEEGLEELVSKVSKEGRFKATTNYKTSVEHGELIFICVGTPSKPNGDIDLTQVESASKQIGEALKEKKGFLSIVFRSTVVPGTTENAVIKNIESASGKKRTEHFSVCYSPEFLREGRAIKDEAAAFGTEKNIAP